MRMIKRIVCNIKNVLQRSKKHIVSHIEKHCVSYIGHIMRLTENKKGNTRVSIPHYTARRG